MNARPARACAIAGGRSGANSVLVTLGTIIALGGLLHLDMASVPTLGSKLQIFGLRRCLIEFAIGTATWA